MATFHDFVTGLSNALEAEYHHRERCLEFLPKMVKAIIDGLQWPEDHVQFYKLTEDQYGRVVEEVQTRIRPALVTVADGSFDLGLEFELPSRYSDDPNIRVSAYVVYALYRVSIKNEKDDFIIRIGDTKLTVKDDDKGLAQVVSFFEKTFQELVTTAHSTEGKRRFGFPLPTDR